MKTYTENEAYEMLNKKEPFYKKVWSNIVYYTYYCPKSIYKTIRHWFWCNFNKEHYRTSKMAVFHTYPWDYHFMLKLQLSWLKESYKYFLKKSYVISEAKTNANLKYIRLAISCLEIMLEKRDLWHFDYKSGKPEYMIDVHVNDRNMERFKYRCFSYGNEFKAFYTTEMYKTHKDELYKAKAKNIYYKIIREHSDSWWD